MDMAVQYTYLHIFFLNSRSAYPLTQNTWHRISVNRAGRRATLSVRTDLRTTPESTRTAAEDTRTGAEVARTAAEVTRATTDGTRSVKSRGSARRLTLHQALFLGGAPEPLPQRLALHTLFSGCVGRVSGFSERHSFFTLIPTYNMKKVYKL